jgi:GNAT superfamily N-acetyltransferase
MKDFWTAVTYQEIVFVVASPRLTVSPRRCCLSAALAGRLRLLFSQFLCLRRPPGLCLKNILVLPAFRGLGIDQKVFAFLPRRALESGCSSFELSVLH